MARRAERQQLIGENATKGIENDATKGKGTDAAKGRETDATKGRETLGPTQTQNKFERRKPRVRQLWTIARHNGPNHLGF